MTTIARRMDEWARWVAGWFRQAEGWQIALLALVGLFVLPMIPFVLAILLVAAVVLFARAWLREFTYLMTLGDDAFPGRNDKLIWAMLLIVLPPVGAWLFQNYRELHWPEAKSSKGRVYDL